MDGAGQKKLPAAPAELKQESGIWCCTPDAAFSRGKSVGFSMTKKNGTNYIKILSFHNEKEYNEKRSPLLIDVGMGGQDA